MDLFEFLLFAAYSIAFRWAIFDYKRTAFFRDFARRFEFTHPLLDCIYCQAIEAATIVAIARPYISILFAILTVGLIAIAIDATVDKAIDDMEIQRGHNNANPRQESEIKSPTESQQGQKG